MGGVGKLVVVGRVLRPAAEPEPVRQPRHRPAEHREAKRRDRQDREIGQRVANEVDEA